MVLWRCTVCGYVSSGSEPPERCPRCQALKEKFEAVPVKRPVAKA